MESASPDVRRVVIALASRWRLIAVLAVGCAALAWGVGYVLVRMAPVYEAQSSVLVSRARLNFRLEQRIETSQDSVSAGAGAFGALSTRLQTLAVLARAGEVEAAVQQRLGGQLPEAMRRPGGLTGAIRVAPRSELLQVTARAPDPELAAVLANVWAEEVAARVEAVYSVSAGAEALDAEVEKARLELESADRALSRFDVDNPFSDLNRRVSAKTDEIKALQDQRVAFFRAKAARLYANLATIDQLIRDAETLEQQMREPARTQAAASGDALAVMILRVRSYLPVASPLSLGDGASSGASSGAAAGDTRPAVTIVQPGGQSSPIPIQLSANAAGMFGDQPQDWAIDLGAMVVALRGRRAEMQGEFQQLIGRLQEGLGPSGAGTAVEDDPVESAMTQATAELQRLRADLAELSRPRDELANLRTVHTTSYQALLNKAQELRVARATSGGEGVVVASRSLGSGLPVEPRPIVLALMAGLAGATLGGLFVLRTELRGWLAASARPASTGASGGTDEPAPRPAYTQAG